MGSADDVTLHLQYWFYAVGYFAAIAGILAPRVRSAIFVPLFFLILLAPSSSSVSLGRTRMSRWASSCNGGGSRRHLD